MNPFHHYVLSIDQSTQGTKAMLFDETGRMTARSDRPHRQIVNELGWVEHDPNEILNNVIGACGDVIRASGISPENIAALGISNQRETSLMWNKETGEPVCRAIVWQCSRAEEICRRHEASGEAENIRKKTGITLSPYFPAAKLQWIMEHVPEAAALAEKHLLAAGTIDSWLIFHLTGGKYHRTDYSNASRTQLFNLHTLRWDRELCASFGIPIDALPEVCMSDSVFGMTDIGGVLPHEVPICAVLGDSHAALFGQNCRKAGQIKSTYGTGSSVMMNIGDEFVLSDGGLVTSLAWGINGSVQYVLEGNLNYTGAVISWLKDDVGLITSASETGPLAEQANPKDKTYFVPAFTGLGAPYWAPDACGVLSGVTRTTGRKEIVKACVECIAYQITDLIRLMRSESGLAIPAVHVDGGPTANTYLMQFQSDIADAVIRIPGLSELSGMGAAYAAGISAGLYDPDTIFDHIQYHEYLPAMPPEELAARYAGWQKAVRQALL